MMLRLTEFIEELFEASGMMPLASNTTMTLRKWMDACKNRRINVYLEPI